MHVNTCKSDGTTKNGEGVTKLEVVDPNEAERRRALAEVVREELEITKEAGKDKNVHSALGSRKRRTNTRTDSSKKGALSAAKSKIKRVKDI